MNSAHQLAATVIARCWRRWRYRAIFQALKAALYKSERTVSVDIMKKLCPREAEFVTDPIMQPRVRFRFGGEMFPPRIMYKVYTKSKNVHYFCGNRLIESGSQAARDACRVMGTRAFTEIAVSKELYMNSRRIAEPSDVTNRMDFVKYMNEIDSLAPKFGGRNNGWRELSFAALQTQATIYDNNPLSKPITLRKTRKANRKDIKKMDPHLGQHHMNQFQMELEDDFVNLFEWTTNLHLGDLEDYVAV